jgi:hypothetical protein
MESKTEFKRNLTPNRASNNANIYLMLNEPTFNEANVVLECSTGSCN